MRGNMTEREELTAVVARVLVEKGRLKPGGEVVRYARIAVEAVRDALRDDPAMAEDLELSWWGSYCPRGGGHLMSPEADWFACSGKYELHVFSLKAYA